MPDCLLACTSCCLPRPRPQDEFEQETQAAAAAAAAPAEGGYSPYGFGAAASPAEGRRLGPAAGGLPMGAAAPTYR